jgi:hypothetical protein
MATIVSSVEWVILDVVLTDHEKIDIYGIHGAPLEAGKRIPALEKLSRSGSQELCEYWSDEETGNTHKHTSEDA